MTNITAVVLALAVSVPAHAQSPNPLTSGAKFHYGIIKGYVTRAAAKMPDEHYPFRPTPEVRTFAQLIGHLADANYRLCSVLADCESSIDWYGQNKSPWLRFPPEDLARAGIQPFGLIPEERLDEIFALHPIGAAGARCRTDYLACLANCRGAIDAEAGHDRCRKACLDCLRESRLAAPLLVSLEAELEALEAEISERT